MGRKRGRLTLRNTERSSSKAPPGAGRLCLGIVRKSLASKETYLLEPVIVSWCRPQSLASKETHLLGPVTQAEADIAAVEDVRSVTDSDGLAVLVGLFHEPALRGEDDDAVGAFHAADAVDDLLAVGMRTRPGRFLRGGLCSTTRSRAGSSPCMRTEATPGCERTSRHWSSRRANRYCRNRGRMQRRSRTSGK
jgi:hypothetical protein